MVSYQILDSSSYITTDWAGGRTQQLYLSPADGDYSKREFDFRISTATVELESSCFSPLPCIKRLLLTLDQTLHLTNKTIGQEVRLAPFQVYAFDGSDQIESCGQCQDFNVMWREPYQGDLRPLAPGEILRETDQIQFVYALTDQEIRINQHVLFLKAHQFLKLVRESPEEEITVRLSSGQSKQAVLAIWIGLSSNGQ
ncbi:environmental stress-induced protein Ves [Streptococcus rupicaprae]|uniref:Environmental stress-induced protein Ves n=1 Tax=Streptococcus rupicaprae TaxID=759619 RepID=A0ABV2FKC8_9STRE